MSMTTTITTRAEALAALQDLTARERAAVRVLLACAHDDGEDGRGTPSHIAPEHSRHAYAARALPPRTVTRPRVVADPHRYDVVWQVESGDVQITYVDAGSLPMRRITAERAAIIADLLANPTETVEADDDA